MPAPARPERILARALVAGRAVIVFGFRSEAGTQMILARFDDGGGGGGWFPAKAVTRLVELEGTMSAVLEEGPDEFIPKREDERQ